ncbi:MAG TPA: methyl-accepting chemotaxis protein [Gemmatimonadaceae bacterium]|nr:methyl-accepting chemotaxis protein [Gemmatimonadaceae bacterium]
MNAAARRGLRSIRIRLLLGFGLLAFLVVATGLFGRSTVSRLADEISSSLGMVQRDARMAARLSASVAQGLAAADLYLSAPSQEVRDRFSRYIWDAHAVKRDMNRTMTHGAGEATLIAGLDAKLSAVEIDYSLAHRLTDLGRRDEARVIANRARGRVDPLLNDVRTLGENKTRQFESAATALRSETLRRSLVLLVVALLTVVVGVVVVLNTVNFITRPLEVLVAHARALSDGKLSARTTSELPGEFQELASAMNSASASLERVSRVASATADDVAASARDLAGVTQQISAAATEMAASMGEISGGADSQVRQIRSVDDALRTLRGSADTVRHGAAELTALAGGIEDQAMSKRQEIARALGILTDVRTNVQRAASEVVALNRAADDIENFVSTVSRIAEQTDLLALNAAIEAARAGAAGRGFAVVADEVRKLAEQAQRAADDVVRLTRAVTAQIDATTEAMGRSAARVSEIESLSREVDEALTSISNSAERTRAAAGAVSAEADRTAETVSEAVTGMTSIARTAEGHAAAAQQVSASTQEQSAACEQLSSASTQLVQGSMQLRQLVGTLRVESSNDYGTDGGEENFAGSNSSAGKGTLTFTSE